jgi:hypothetical protein
VASPQETSREILLPPRLCSKLFALAARVLASPARMTPTDRSKALKAEHGACGMAVGKAW